MEYFKHPDHGKYDQTYVLGNPGELLSSQERAKARLVRAITEGCLEPGSWPTAVLEDLQFIRRLKNPDGSLNKRCIAPDAD